MRNASRYRNNKRNKSEENISRRAYVTDFIDGQGRDRTADTRIFRKNMRKIGVALCFQ